MGKESIRTSGRTEWKYVLLGACVLATVASFPLLATKAKAPAGMDAKRIRARVKFLSSDALEGRGMGQKGSEAAADYIGKQLEFYGLKPAGDDGTYFQKVPMVGGKTLPHTTFEVQSNGAVSLGLEKFASFFSTKPTQ